MTKKILTLSFIVLTIIKLNSIIVNSNHPMLIGLSLLISLSLLMFFPYKTFFNKDTKLKFLN